MEQQLDTHNKYKKIESLHELLVKECIPHEYVPIFDGMQCIFYYKGNNIGDFVEHFFSYGLEGYGFGQEDVFPYLTEDIALNIVKRYIKRMRIKIEYEFRKYN